MAGEAEAPVLEKPKTDVADTSDDGRDSQVEHLKGVLAGMEEGKAVEALPKTSGIGVVNPNLPDPRTIDRIEVSPDAVEAYKVHKAAQSAARQDEVSKKLQRESRKASTRIGRFAGGVKKALLKTFMILSTLTGR